jgi:hypothetical protein
MNDKKRIQFDFTDKAFDRLKELRDKNKAKSMAEIVRNALRIYDFLLEMKTEGYEVKLHKGEEAIKLPDFIF